MKTRDAIVTALCIAALAGFGSERASAQQAAAKKGGAAPKETLEFDASVEMPKPVKQVPPKYPDEARKRGEQGIVLVRALVKKDGTVGQAFVPRGKGATPALDRAALQAVRQWTFEPAKKNGKPVDVYVVVPVKFALDVKGK